MMATHHLLVLTVALHHAPLLAHDLGHTPDSIHASPTSVSPARGDGAASTTVPHQAAAFARFAPKVRLRWDKEFLFIESKGLPDHGMMTGIRAWQQQVPLPQDYTGTNAWRIPRAPVPAADPAMIRNRFLRGAIAIAANGVPIFNPQNNRGEISADIGELDHWGGHCGRGDDYHYHTAPLHLQETLGKTLPIAHALDGYPVYGSTEPDGSAPTHLDPCGGHDDPGLGYHYHASTHYPFVIGGFHGRVHEVDGQVDPQPRAQPVRPALPALRGATVTGFERRKGDAFRLDYTVDGAKGSVTCTPVEGGRFDFQFQPPGEPLESVTYGPDTRRSPRAGEQPARDGAEPARRPQAPEGNPPPPSERPMRAPDDGPGGTRKPWLEAHAAELDADQDGHVTLDETKAEARRTFAGFDANHDGALSDAEINGPAPHSPMAGFVTQHPEKIDANSDQQVGAAELETLVTRMFTKADADGDGRIPVTTPAPQTEARPDPKAVPARPSGHGQPRTGPTPKPPTGRPGLVKPELSDTRKLNVYADNWFILYLNGRPIAVDSIAFTPHNVVCVDVLPEYPMTLAVLAKDNADPATGMEYGTSIGDGGFILKFSDGTVTNASWKAKCFFRGPLDRNTTQPKVSSEPLPERWWAVDFDDHAWSRAKEYTEQEVDPKPTFHDHDFTGAKFIWTDDLALDNTVIFRTRIERPDWEPRWNTRPDLDVSNAPLK